MTTLFIWLFNFAFAASAPEGIYERPCMMFEDEDVLSSELIIKDNTWTTTHTAFEDTACETPYLIFQTIYKTKSQANEVDLTAVEFSYTILTDEVAEALNFIEYCGFHDWQTGISKDVTGLQCSDFTVPASGEKIYSVIEYNEAGPLGSELYLGIPSIFRDGKTPETRHDQTDIWPYYLRAHQLEDHQI